MLNINEIEKFYPFNYRVHQRSILKEFLQFKILDSIYQSDFAKKLVFIGGTCLRIVYGTNRFSEDLDFDNFGLTNEEFMSLSALVSNKLQMEGYTVETKIVTNKAFRCYIRIPNLLFDNKLSGFREEKILIQIDTENQQLNYESKKHILNKFDVLTQIFHAPSDILLAQKIWAILNRKTPKGRDFYDVLFLFGITQPNFHYLDAKTKIDNMAELKNRLLARLTNIDFEQLIIDLKPFLINQDEIYRLKLFPDFIESLK